MSDKNPTYDEACGNAVRAARTAAQASMPDGVSAYAALSLAWSAIATELRYRPNGAPSEEQA